MKKQVLSFVIFIFLTVFVSANDTNKLHLTIGGYGGPFSNFSIITAKPVLMFGGGGGFVVNRKLFIGGFGMETTDKIDIKANIADYKLNVEYGGLWIQYKVLKYKSFSISTSLKTGFGEVKMISKSSSNVYSDNLVVYVPEIIFSKRFNGVMGIDFGIFYNHFTEINFQNYSNSDFSNIGASIMMKFGSGY